MQRYYGLDLRVLVASESPRRVWALVHGLPPEAECFRRPQEQAEAAQTDQPYNVVSIRDFVAAHRKNVA